METEIRKLPKKTVFFMVLLIVLGIFVYVLVDNAKSLKVSKILNSLGYNNIKDVKIYAKHEFLREDINVKGYKYTVSFINLKTNEKCKGFVLKDFKKNIDKDLLCTKLQ